MAVSKSWMDQTALGASNNMLVRRRFGVVSASNEIEHCDAALQVRKLQPGAVGPSETGLAPSAAVC